MIDKPSRIILILAFAALSFVLYLIIWRREIGEPVWPARARSPVGLIDVSPRRPDFRVSGRSRDALLWSLRLPATLTGRGPKNASNPRFRLSAGEPVWRSAPAIGGPGLKWRT